MSSAEVKNKSRVLVSGPIGEFQKVGTAQVYEGLSSDSTGWKACLPPEGEKDGIRRRATLCNSERSAGQSSGQQHAAQLTSAEKPTSTTQPSAQSAKQAKRVGYSEPAVTILLGIIHQPSPSRYRKWLLDPVGISYSPSAASA